MLSTPSDHTGPENIQPPVKSTRIFQRFFKKLAHGGYPIFLSAIIAIAWANASYDTYHSFWHTDISISIGPFHMVKSLAHWVDEALMTLFFFTVGLEIKREFLVGGLSSPKQAIVPVVAAIGGMICPAFLYVMVNFGMETAKGWGIPMATDIAFALAILSFLGKRIPYGIKIFLTALAIADDLGAVLVIAFFYTPTVVWSYLQISTIFIAGMAIANLLWVRGVLVYVILGIGLWFAVLGSGIHATVAGVIVAMFIPGKGKYDTDTFVRNVKFHLNAFECQTGCCGDSILLNRDHLNAVQSIDLACQDVETPLQRLEHGLQSWIAFLVLPLFALANSGLTLKGLDLWDAMFHPVTLGVIKGLVFGKPLGICLFTYLAVKIFNVPLEKDFGWRHIIGVGFLGGIGFTMSLFISGLSFANPQYMEFARLGIIIGSLFSGITGYLILASGHNGENHLSESDPVKL